MQPSSWIALAAVVSAAGGCMPSRAEVFGPVAAGASERTGHDVAWRSPMMSDEHIRSAVRELLAGGLELDEAVRIGLLNDQRLQASFDELGIARGDLAAASVLDNSIPMLGGPGPFDYIDMGGMFTIFKVRDRLSGTGDPGWFQHPDGTVATRATDAELRADGIEAP